PRARPPAPSSPFASSLRSRTRTHTMATATETPPAPAEATSPVARVLKEALGADVLKVEEFRGDLAITVAPSAWVRAATLLKTRPELDFKLFLHLCGVDPLHDEGMPERFEVALLVS